MSQEDKDSPKAKKMKLSRFGILSWNVDGVRAWLKKGGWSYVTDMKEDSGAEIVCLQEIKCAQEKIPKEISDHPDYPHQYWHPAEKDGYAGTAVLCRKEPLREIQAELKNYRDEEGRIVALEFEDFYLVTTYVPNAGRKLVTLDKRLEWDPAFRGFLQDLDEKKPVIACGDFNVAHGEIDLANPKTNKKNAGFTPEERDGFGKLLESGPFVDSFRHFYPDLEKKYTFWTYMMNCRAKNVGWRLDYFLVSRRMIQEKKIKDSLILDQALGSDHCPIQLWIDK